MPQGGQGQEGDLADTLGLAGAALAALEASRRRIDDLNVYPVPDGDTGTNMTLTVRAVVDALERLPPDSDAIGATIVRACLMGARGNSGVILSQLVRGAVEGWSEAGQPGAGAVAAALRGASEAGYASVREPKEGTILTVAQALADRAEALARSQPAAGDLLRDLVGEGERALAATQDQLDVLREAGVVDAGAAGLVEIVRGIAAHVRGEALSEPLSECASIPLEAVHFEASRFRYCTSFFVEGADVDPGPLERELEAFGDSLLVVGAPKAVKVHLHTDEPGKVLALATAVGVIEEVDVRNMHVQQTERTGRLTRAAGIAVAVTVCAGAGNRRLFESLGASCVEGGPTTNPSVADLLAAIEVVPEAEVLLLPNDGNVLLTAERAAEAAAKHVLVVPTTTLQAGLGALVAFDPARPAAENAEAMTAAAAGVRAGAVTRASRTTALGGLAVEEGQFLGLVEEEPVSAGPVLETVAREVIERLVGEGVDVLTVLVGDGVASADGLVDEVREAHPELEVEVHEGGQPHYPLLLAAE